MKSVASYILHLFPVISNRGLIVYSFVVGSGFRHWQ